MIDYTFIRFTIPQVHCCITANAVHNIQSCKTGVRIKGQNCESFDKHKIINFEYLFNVDHKVKMPI